MLNSQSWNHCRAVGGTLGTPDWHRGFAELEETGPDGEPTATLVDYHQVFDSIVEVIDVELSHRYAEPRIPR